MVSFEQTTRWSLTSTTIELFSRFDFSSSFLFQRKNKLTIKIYRFWFSSRLSGFYKIWICYFFSHFLLAVFFFFFCFSITKIKMDHKELDPTGLYWLRVFILRIIVIFWIFDFCANVWLNVWNEELQRRHSKSKMERKHLDPTGLYWGNPGAVMNFHLSPVEIVGKSEDQWSLFWERELVYIKHIRNNDEC